SMRAHCFLRGVFAMGSFALCYLGPTAGKAQDILKELEEGEQQDQNHQTHEHGGVVGTKKKGASTEHQNHSGHGTKPKGASNKHQDHRGHTRTMTHDGAHRGTGAPHQHKMHGFLGPYPIQREGSGTSWLPDTTPHFGVHGTYGNWQTMYHALFNLVYDHQGGPRGGDKTFLSGMFMGMA